MIRTIGPRAIDDIVPSLFALISEDDDDASSKLALSGLREIVKVRSKDLLEYVLSSRLMSSAITVVGAKILIVIAEGCGPNLNHYFSVIVPHLTQELFTAWRDVDTDAEDLSKAARLEAVKAW